MKGVAITGIGIVTSLGRGAHDHLEAMRSGRHALTPLSLFEAPGIGQRPAGQVDEKVLAPPTRGSRSQRLATAAATDALSGLRPQVPGVLAVGTTTGGIFESEQHYLKHRGREGLDDRELLRNHALGTVVDRLANFLKLPGERHTFATACSSSANAIGYAASRVQAGAPWALAGGVDSLCRLTWAGFYALKLLSPDACKPFDATRAGLSLGEAAAFVMLEPEAAARARNARIYGYVTGWGCAADAYHMTSPHPEGAGAVRAILAALADAGRSPAQVSYVNAHGTATPANDKIEALALQAVFGEGMPPVSSTKGATGHTLGAAGAVEAVLSLLSMLEGLVPLSVGLQTPDPALQVRHVTPATQRGQFDVVLSNSFGFGGNNTALVLERGA